MLLFLLQNNRYFAQNRRHKKWLNCARDNIAEHWRIQRRVCGCYPPPPNLWIFKIKYVYCFSTFFSLPISSPIIANPGFELAEGIDENHPWVTDDALLLTPPPSLWNFSGSAPAYLQYKIPRWTCEGIPKIISFKWINRKSKKNIYG